MNTGDVRLQESVYNSVPTRQWFTKAGNTALNPGEFVKEDGATGAGYVVVIADAAGTNGDLLVGLVKSKDNVGANNYGTVDVYMPLPGIIYAAKAKTSTNANTDAKIIALVGKRVIFDVTSSVITIDTGAADAVTNAVKIVGGNSQTSEIYFILNVGATYLGSLTQI